jgi:hypothetical protein
MWALKPTTHTASTQTAASVVFVYSDDIAEVYGRSRRDAVS